MNRFGDFTLLEELGSSEVADRFRAVHDTHGGPFFLKCYYRLPPERVPELMRRADRLIGQRHPNLCHHMGHGDANSVQFVVAPLVEGVTLSELLARCREAGASLKPATALYIAREVATGLKALHALGEVNPMTHGELSAEHVRVTPEGQIMITGIPTPRSLVPGQPLSTAWDTMGLAALLYDLFRGTRLKADRTELPGAVAVEAQRALTPTEQTSVDNLVKAIEDTAKQLGIANLDRTGLLEIMARSKARPASSSVDDLPTLEPIEPAKPIEPHVSRPGVLRRAEHAPAPAPAPVTVDDVELPRAARPMPTPTLRTPEPAPQPPPQPAPQPPPQPRPAPRLTPAAAPAPPKPAPPRPAPPRPAPEPPRQRPKRPPLPSSPLVERTTTGPQPAPFAKTAPQPVAATTPDQRPVSDLPPDIPSDSGHLGGLSSLPIDETDPFAPTAEAHPPARPPSTPPRPAGGFLLADPVEPAVEATAPRAAPPSTLPSAAPTSQTSSPAVDALLSRGLIDADTLSRATAAHERKGGRLLEVVMKLADLDDRKVADVLAAAALKPRITSRDLEARAPGPELVRRLPQTFVLSRRVLPLKLEGGELELAVLDPFDEKVIDEVKTHLAARSVKIGVVARKSLARVAKQAYARIGVSADPLDAQEGPVVMVCVPDTEVMAIGARFADEGMSVEYAANADLARQIIVDRPPDAVVCAAEFLPRDGDSLLSTLRARTDFEDEPFFVVGEPDDLAAAFYIEIGADDYFDRPLNLDVLVAKLRRAVGKRRRRKKSAPPPSPMMSEFSLPPGDVPAADIAGLADLPDLGGPDDLGNPLSAPPMTDPAVSAEFGVVQDAPPIQPTGVMGTLKQMAVADIVQSLELGRKNARVELHPMNATEESGPGKGILGFTNGACTYAEYNGLLGDEAFFQLARFTEGFFRIRYGEGAPEPQNIHKQTQFLLLEAMRIMDEGGG